MHRRHLCLQSLLMIAVLMAGSKSIAGEDCSKTFNDLALDPNKLPPVATTESLYTCFGIAQHLQNLDRLERDLVIMDAMNNTWEEFKRSEVHGGNKTYEQKIPIERLREFHSFISSHAKK